MRKIILSLSFIIYTLTANAQLTALVEDFNTSCASATGFPLDWLNSNSVAGTNPNGAWHCAPGNGRWGTPGMQCSGVWGSPSQYYLDTAYLVSPSLNLTGYSGNIFLEFDTKTSRIDLGARLFFMAGTVDTLFGISSLDTFNLTRSLSPVFTSGDSSGWVTHEVDLTPYKNIAPLYVAFMYTSTTTTGGIWYLDNIHTTIYPVQVPHIIKDELPLTVVGISTSSQITLSYKAANTGVYHIAIYDILGHIAHEEDVNATQDNTTYIITGLNLHSGMYLIKMGNGLVYNTAKTIVQ